MSDFLISTPLISICIPVYNGSNFIADAIESVLNQSYPNFELVIVDNCSTDRTAEIAQSFSDKRIKYHKNSNNIGAINNFKRSVELARGELFVLLPHDDYLLPDCLNKLSSKFSDPKISLVFASVAIVDENRQYIGATKSMGSDLHMSPSQAIYELIDKFTPIQLAMVRTEKLKAITPFELTYGVFSDVHTWAKLAFSGCDFYYLYETYSCHRCHEKQGQNAFLKPNLSIVSEHWGRKLSKQFWRENSYSYLLYKLSCFFIDEIKSQNFVMDNIEYKLLKLSARSNARAIFLSLLSLSLGSLLREFILLAKIIKFYGVKTSLEGYSKVIKEELLKRMCAKISIQGAKV